MPRQSTARDWKAVATLGGLTKSPLETPNQCLEELATLINNHGEEWTELELSYLRNFIQGLWIARAVSEVKQ